MARRIPYANYIEVEGNSRGERTYILKSASRGNRLGMYGRTLRNEEAGEYYKPTNENSNGSISVYRRKSNVGKHLANLENSNSKRISHTDKQRELREALGLTAG